MNTSFEKLHHYFKKKEIDLIAYQDYLRTLEANYENLTKFLTQRNISLREFYDFLTSVNRPPEKDPENLLALEVLETSGMISKQIGGYQLLEVLGEGGMGVVYKAYHPGLKQIVAIKLMKAESQSSEKTIQRFLREMQIMAKLEHPGIVKILNSGEEEGRFYLIMEYVQGASLEKKSSQLTLHEKVEILMMVLEALAYAHQRKIIHRDLKLENMMVSETGHPKILDFGLAKELVEER
ncbi:MAG: serine/threonine-protein kinase, partial [Planctomycetota bacterium]